MAPNQANESIYIVSSSGSCGGHPEEKSNSSLPTRANGGDARHIPWGNLLLLGLAQLLGGFAFSLLSPFYTEEATEKGLSVTQTGLVGCHSIKMP